MFILGFCPQNISFFVFIYIYIRISEKSKITSILNISGLLYQQRTPSTILNALLSHQAYKAGTSSGSGGMQGHPASEG